MQAIIVKASRLGPVGTIITGPETWRNCFPSNLGILALPFDAEANNKVAAVLAEYKAEKHDSQFAHLQELFGHAQELLPAALNAKRERELAGAPAAPVPAAAALAQEAAADPAAAALASARANASASTAADATEN